MPCHTVSIMHALTKHTQIFMYNTHATIRKASFPLHYSAAKVMIITRINSSSQGSLSVVSPESKCSNAAASARDAMFTGLPCYKTLLCAVWLNVSHCIASMQHFVLFCAEMSKTIDLMPTSHNNQTQLQAVLLFCSCTSCAVHRAPSAGGDANTR